MNEVEVGIVPIIASYKCNLFQNHFKGTNMVAAFCSTVQKFHWLPVLCWKSRLEVDLKIIISSIANQENQNKILCRTNEEMGGTTFNSW